MAHRINTLIMLLLMLMPFPAIADDIAPVTFARERVILSSQERGESALFQVDIRTAESAVNPDWFQLAGLKPSYGLMVYSKLPRAVDITHANVFAHYDILALNGFGDIIMILPDVVLATLQHSITTPESCKALLYVAAGTADTLKLRIGDQVKHRMFEPRPKVIDASNQAAEVEAGKGKTTAQVDGEEAVPPATRLVPNTNLAGNPPPETPTEPEADGKTPEPPVNTRRRPIANPLILQTP